jgi:antitoxin component of RelBE/YafQ-DinJ toxin-antitoxin module
MRKATDKLQSYGLTVEEALSKFVTNIADGQGAIEYLEIPNEETRLAMAEARNGKTTKFASIDELMADLNTDN